MFDSAGEMLRASGDEGERLRLVGQNLVRGGLAAVFLDRRIFDVAVRADRGENAIAVRRDVGSDRVPQRARTRVENGAGELVVPDEVGERG